MDETSHLPRDGRQSDRALQIQRGICRALRDLGFAPVTEFPLVTGRRMDVLAIGPKSEIWAVEIKSSVADFRADAKWPDYLDWCDRLYFAIPQDVPAEILPETAGLAVADQHGAEFLRHPQDRPLAAARRKAVMLRFARAAAMRLHQLADPGLRHLDP